jgi:class 3 adenylate cyclase/tetratricopeptide (TPR) repeat protein
MVELRAPERIDERKLVTILFADVVGSTELGERLDPERLQVLLAGYFRAMTAIIQSWGGTVEKYIGDAIMAAFGVPAVHEDDPQRAIGAALEMLERLSSLNREFRERHDVELQIRIGVNTGDVIAPVGEATSQMIVAGDAVNVAARLEGAADPGTILVGDRTHAAAADAFGFEGPRSLELKGKARPVAAWRVVGRSILGERSDRPQAPMIGRDREIRGVTEALDDAIESGRPRLVLVFGPAGIGKSRLTREFLETLGAARADLVVLRGRCLSAGQGITYWALGEIVRHAFGISLDDPPGLARERLERGVRTLLEPMEGSERDVRDTIFAFAISSGIRIPDNPFEQMRPVAVATELARAWPRFAAAQAHRGPVVLLVEDLHWADDQLLAILEAIFGRTNGPFLLLVTARPEFAETHPAFAAGREGFTSLSLKPLLERHEIQLMASLLGTDAVPSELQDVLLDRAEGNPFFLEQLVGSLIDSGVLTRDGDRWRLTGKIGAVTLPDTVQGVLSARIDRLPPPEKRVMQAAAIVGRTFWAPAVALSVEEELVVPALAGLESKGLVLARPASSVGRETEYAFKHALIHDVAYGSIPMARRARSHALVGAWLEGLAGEGDESLLELVAFHYRAALRGEGADLAWADDPVGAGDLRERAFEVLMEAGAVARRRNAIARAVELHEAGLELALDENDRARAHEELGDDHGWGYHGDPSVEAWNAALQLQQALGDDEAIARICLKAARTCAVYWGGFADRPSGATVDRYVDSGLAHVHDQGVRAWLLMLRGRASEAWAASSHPDPVEPAARIAAAQEAVDLAAGVDDIDLQVMALRSLGGLVLLGGDTARSLELAEQELAIIDRVAVSRDRLLSLSQVLGRIMDIGGDLERALELARKALPDARELSTHERMHATYFVMAPLYRLGRLEEIRPFAAEHLRAFDDETVDMNCPYTRSGPVVAALAFDLLGDSEAARNASERIAPNDEKPGLVEAWMAERAARAGDAASAREIVERPLMTGRTPSMEEPPYEFPVLVEALASAGDWPALEAALPKMRDATGRVAWLAPAIERAEGLRLMARGDRTEADAALARALDSYRRLGMANEEAATRELLGGMEPT